MDISQTGAVTAGAGLRTRSSADSSILTSDFETFLRMLTVQAQYQDPLEPIDASDYSAQLAQFSMVEQQVLSNELLGSLTAALNASGIAALAGWVGMEARSTSAVQFDGAPISLALQADPTADQAYLVVRDDDGREVLNTAIPVDTRQMEWDGRDASGGQLASGVYSFFVENLSDGKVTSTAPVEAYARITEAQIENGDTVLVLAGGARLTAERVTALREGRQG